MPARTGGDFIDLNVYKILAYKIIGILNTFKHILAQKHLLNPS